MSRIVDHRRHFGTTEPGMDFHVQHFWPAHEDRFDPKKPHKKDPHAVAVINGGRWIVRCPHCTGAQMADPDDRRFFCIDCLMQAVQGRWADVDWPAAAITPAIEAALLERPVSARNWEPEESVSFLLAENVMHGTGSSFSRRTGAMLDDTGSVALPPDPGAGVHR
jgi:hypothetical protein